MNERLNDIRQVRLGKFHKRMHPSRDLGVRARGDGRQLRFRRELRKGKGRKVSSLLLHLSPSLLLRSLAEIR